VDKFLEIIKHFWPRFYNRITWTVVIGGMALISAPLWETLVSALIAKEFDLSAYIPNEPLYGTILVGLGLAYHLGASIIESAKEGQPNAKKLAAQEHDKELARRFLGLATEDEVIYQLEMIGGDHSCNDDRWKILSGIERFGNLAENEFLDPVIQEKMVALHADCKNLTTFMATHFFPMSGNGSRTYLYPELNVDRRGNGSPEDSARYNSYAIPMIALVTSAMDNYRILRRAIKTQLAI
jgi:hypothetical protein